jgi:hypothetical protein
VIAMNGQPTSDEQAVRRSMRQLASGDTVRVEVEHAGTRRTVAVVMAPFDRPFVHLREVSSPTAEQRALRARWESGAP